jgi:tRNA-dihydrouridine synthase B
MTATEMVSARALTFGDEKTKELLYLSPGEHPCRRADLRPRTRRSWPRPPGWRWTSPARTSSTSTWAAQSGKVVKSGDGSALMRDPALASEIISSVVAAVDVPVTVKFRKGFDGGQRKRRGICKNV